MILTLAWKEYREHRSVWLTLVVLTTVLGYGLAQLISPGEAAAARLNVVALTILALAATYGVVCGAMMFAGEREAGTLVFLDIFLGRRGLLWFGKGLIGVVLALSQALAVALVLHFLKQEAPPWLPTFIGREGLPRENPAAPSHWFLVLPVVTLEAFAWGLLGSSLTRRALSGAALAALIAIPFWLAVSAPPAIFLGIRVVGAVVALVISLSVFLNQALENPQGPSPRPARPNPFGPEVHSRGWEESALFNPQAREPASAWDARPAPDILLPIPQTLLGPEWVHRRKDRPPQARTQGQVLWWLTFRQARVLLCVLLPAALVAGNFLPDHGQVLWPVATLLLGVACGTAAFAPEQRDLSYQFLAAQHFPLKAVWNFKTLFWLGTAVLVALLAGATGALVSVGKHLTAADPEVAGFGAGTLPELLGPVLFYGIWLAYGIAVAQLFVLFCRKTLLAVLLSGLVGAAALGLWLPSLLAGGMSGWLVWVPPLVLLAAGRCLVRAWAGGRIKDRRPLVAVIGFTAATLAWVVLNFGYRAWEIPDAGEPLDREAYRASARAADSRAGPLIREALREVEHFKGEEGPWLARMAEAARLPAGVIVTPPGASQTAVLRRVLASRKVTDKLRGLARAALKEGKPRRALEHLTQILALSRNLRNKAPLASYLAGVEAEASALEGLDQWLAQKRRPAPGLLRRALAELNRHAAETPPPLDCLQTECYRAGGKLKIPISWAFASDPQATDQVPERWLVGGIALSLEMPWEKERKKRLWRLVWSGLFRAVQTPYWELPPTADEPVTGRETTRRILRGWSPAAEGPGSSLTVEDLARLLDASWLSDERLFAPVVELRAAATRGRWRVDACRLALALALYRLQEEKPAKALTDLVPRYLRQLPLDPYSGRPFRYRVGRGEPGQIAGDPKVHGRDGPERIEVPDWP